MFECVVRQVSLLTQCGTPEVQISCALFGLTRHSRSGSVMKWHSEWLIILTNVILAIDDNDATVYADEGMRVSTSDSDDESEGDFINESDDCSRVVQQMITLCSYFNFEIEKLMDLIHVWLYKISRCFLKNCISSHKLHKIARSFLKELRRWEKVFGAAHTNKYEICTHIWVMWM